MATASAQATPDLRAFAAAVPDLRTRIGAQDWQGFHAAAQAFSALRPDLQRREETDDLLNALLETGMWRSPPPTDAMTRGLLADSFGEWAIADACYQEHIANGPVMSWGARSGFLGYRARLAVHRGDLDLAQRLLVEQREQLHREQATPEPTYVAQVDSHLRAVRDLAAAPTDGWRRLGFARAYWRTTYPPVLSPLHAVRRELERLLGEPAVRKDRALLLAIRCEQIAAWPTLDETFDPRALPAAVACVDAGLPAAAAQRRDVTDPWAPLLTMGVLLKRAGDPTRALVAFDALVAGAAALPLQAVPVRWALVAGAECAIECGDGTGSLRRLDRAEREFPLQASCGWDEGLRIERLRERARAAGGR